MKSGIYTITNIANGKMYVGLALDLQSRKNIHWKKLREGKHKNSHLQSAWNGYGELSFVFEVIEQCEETFLCSQEHYWATLLDTHNRERGYNIKPTHPNGLSRFSQEMKQKMSNKATGRKHTAESIDKMKNRDYSNETREKMADAKRGKKQSPETIEKRADKLRGIKRSDDFGKKISDSKKGKRMNDKSIEKMRLSKSIPVIQLDIQGNFIKDWSSAKTAADELNLQYSCINSVCNNKQGRKQHGGFRWKFKN